MKFSQRIGEEPIKEIQLNSMDDALRTSLWNVFLQSFLLHESRRTLQDSGIYVLYKRIWCWFLKLPLDECPSDLSNATSEIKRIFSYSEWHQVYDFIEYVMDNLNLMDNPYCTPFSDSKDDYISIFNHILKEEFSGYRFIDGRLSPITNEHEMEAVKTALDNSKSKKLSGVHEHIKTANSNISNKTDPDYRNSIKESISAVESIVKLIANDSNGTLPKALKKIGETIKLHPAQIEGFIKLYGYTSDESGIRHGLTEKDNSDFEDAQYMLVSCSAFVNYLIMKAEKSGIKL